MKRIEARGRYWSAPILAGLVGLALVSCVDSSSDHADNGGIGGTGVTQGQIDAFGSIFSNGVEWDLARASIEVEGALAAEADLRVGMQVRVVGDFQGDGSTGVAAQVVFDPDVIGPVASPPTLVPPDGLRKQLSILGRTVLADVADTKFGPGVDFDTLAEDQVLRASGIETPEGSLLATRLDLLGSSPTVDSAELGGVVANLLANPDDTGIFDLGPITIRYTAATVFTGLLRSDLRDGLPVDVRGVLRASGVEIDADAIERQVDPLVGLDLDDVELEGFVTDFASPSDFRVRGVPVDASGAAFEPVSLVLANGLLVEVEGRLVSGVVQADRVEQEGSEGEGDEVKLRAAVASVDLARRELAILGLTVVVAGETEIEDERDGESNFGLDDIEPGDWLEIEARLEPGDGIEAHSIHRKDAQADVRLEGPVTFLDPGSPSTAPPALDVAGRAIPLQPDTEYFDALGRSRSEAQFFRSPGDVVLGDGVRVVDELAVDPGELGEADVVSIE